jgi:hypothetical protein
MFGEVVHAQRPHATHQWGDRQRGGQFGRQTAVPASRLRDGDRIDPSRPQ